MTFFRTLFLSMLMLGNAMGYTATPRLQRPERVVRVIEQPTVRPLIEVPAQQSRVIQSPAEARGLDRMMQRSSIVRMLVSVRAWNQPLWDDRS